MPPTRVKNPWRMPGRWARQLASIGFSIAAALRRAARDVHRLEAWERRDVFAPHAERAEARAHAGWGEQPPDAGFDGRGLSRVGGHEAGCALHDTEGGEELSLRDRPIAGEAAALHGVSYGREVDLRGKVDLPWGAQGIVITVGRDRLQRIAQGRPCVTIVDEQRGKRRATGGKLSSPLGNGWRAALEDVAVPSRLRNGEIFRAADEAQLTVAAEANAAVMPTAVAISPFVLTWAPW